MHPRLALGITLSLMAGLAQAQDATAVDPVLAHYREYRAALDRGDAAAAEEAAQLAYDASEAADGVRTAVLALNLATLRLDLGKPTAAYAPAQRAYELAAANQDSGVDPLVAALAFGRAELAVDLANGAPRLREAITQAEQRDDLQTVAYPATVELARTMFTLEQYGVAREAWAASNRLAAGSLSDPQFARGLARTGEGAAIFMQAIDESDVAPGTRAAVIDRGAARDANEAFADGLSLLQPFADEGEEGVLTLAQSAYAQALAWQGMLPAKMQSQGDELPRGGREGTTQPGAAGRCAVRLVAEPPPAYPSDALLASGVGAVVIRATTDAQGEIIERQIAAAIPSGSFSEAVAAVADQWRIEVADDAAPGCRLDGTQYTPILFVAEE